MDQRGLSRLLFNRSDSQVDDGRRTGEGVRPHWFLGLRWVSGRFWLFHHLRCFLVLLLFLGLLAFWRLGLFLGGPFFGGWVPLLDGSSHLLSELFGLVSDGRELVPETGDFVAKSAGLLGELLGLRDHLPLGVDSIAGLIDLFLGGGDLHLEVPDLAFHALLLQLQVGWRVLFSWLLESLHSLHFRLPNLELADLEEVVVQLLQLLVLLRLLPDPLLVPGLHDAGEGEGVVKVVL